jgi:hypothetical protein
VRDPSVPDMKERKKLMFYDTEKRQADLRVRLKFDGLNQAQFFRAFITGYLEKDERILNYINEFKKKCGVHNEKKRSDTQKLIKKGKDMESEFALNDNEIENIFDILEEHTEL